MKSPNPPSPPRLAIASLHLPDFVLVTLYCPIGENSPQTPVACLVPATLLPVTPSALGDHHRASLPRAAPSCLRELPSAHERVQTPLRTCATHERPHHLRCTRPTSSHAHHVPPLLAQPAPCTAATHPQTPQHPQGRPCPPAPRPLPHRSAHTHSPLDTLQAPGEGGAPSSARKLFLLCAGSNHITHESLFSAGMCFPPSISSPLATMETTCHCPEVEFSHSQNSRG